MAGEDWEMNIDLLRREGGYLVRRSRGLLFLIDPLRIPRGRRAAPADRGGDDRPARRLPGGRRQARPTSSRARPSSTPLAICLNKLDRWGPLLSQGSKLHEIARSVPIAGRPPARPARPRGGPPALRHLGPDGVPRTRLESDFPNHRFFACSALGDAAQERADLPSPCRLRCWSIGPALWLLEQQGVLTKGS